MILPKSTQALIEATRRVIAEAESGSRVRPEIQRLWEQIQDAADQIPSKDPLEAGRSWAQRVLRAVGPPPRDDPAAALAAQDRLEASAREDPVRRRLAARLYSIQWHFWGDLQRLKV